MTLKISQQSLFKVFKINCTNRKTLGASKKNSTQTRAPAGNTKKSVSSTEITVCFGANSRELISERLWNGLESPKL